MIDHYAKVEGHPNLIRDLRTNAIINTDKISSSNYNIVKQKREEERNRIDRMENELSELKSSIDNIKTLLEDLVNGPRRT